MSKKSFVFTAFAMCLALTLSAVAQEITGNIVGTVRDSNGAAVVGATVKITDPSKGITVRTAETNADGEFSAPNIPPSVYTVTIEAANFKKSIQSDVKLDVGTRRSLDIVLEAGKIDESVTVQADAVSIETSTPTSATVINGDQVREISINNRNFISLVTLAPGVTNDLDDIVNTGTNNPDTQVVNRTLISVNGARPTQNTFTVDGADVTDRGSNLTIQAYPSVDSIAEFRVLRSLYPAESGQSAGGQVNVITRSGGNQFHGSLFEFIRNEAFNANTVAINSLANPPFGFDSNGKAKRKPYRYNNYGWTIGGPIYFLRFGEKKPGESFFGKMPRTYFFYSEEFRKDIRYPTLSSVVPTTAMKNGVFPIDICLRGTITAGVGTCDPGQNLTAGTTLPGINPISQQYVSRIWNNVPAPNDPNTLSLIYPALNLANFRQEIVKIDHSFSDRLSFYYRFENDKIPTTDADGSIGGRSGIPFVNTMESNSPGRTHTAQVTWAPSSNVIVEARYVYAFGAIFTKTVGLISKDVSPIPAQLPYPSTRDVVPVLSVLGFNSLTGFSNYDNFSSKQGLGGNVTWIFGSHTTKFGGTFSKYRKNENALTGTNQGQFSGFNNTPLALPAGTTAGVVRSSTPLPANITPAVAVIMQTWANFLLGNNMSFTQSKLDMTADFRQKVIEGFAQDEWRARKGLTLYYGVRYSYFGAPWDKNGQLTNFDKDLWSAANAPQVTGAGNRIGGNNCNGLIINSQNYQTGPASFNCTPTISPWGKYVYHANTTDFAPRVGIAWDPFGKGTSAIRTGFGIYHDQISASATELILAQNPPYQETCNVSATSISQPVPGNNCTAAAGAGVASLRGVQNDFKTPYVEQWSLDYQQQLGKDTVFTVGYYGSRGVHLIGFTEYDNLAPGQATSTNCATGANTIAAPGPGGLVPCQVANTAFTSSAAEVILDQIRPYRGYRSINMLETRYNSNYWGLQVSAQHRFSGASQINLAYTWSKSLTDNPTSYINAAPQVNSDIPAEKGLTPLDRRHVITTNFVYELPFYKKQEHLVGKVLGGWQFSGILSYQTGSPYTVTSATYDPGGIGFIPSIVAGGRPNLTCDPNQGGAHTVANWFNTTCFSAQTAAGISTVPGNAGRGIITGPPTRKVDLTLSKNFRFSETMSVQLRAEAFNVFNLTNFRLGTTPSLSRTATTFGQITSFRDPRIMQFGAKFYF